MVKKRLRPGTDVSGVSDEATRVSECDIYVITGERVQVVSGPMKVRRSTPRNSCEGSVMELGTLFLGYHTGGLGVE